MVKSFDVSYGGPEKVNGIDTDKLELVPKTEKVKGVFNHIELWIDSRGISVWQKFVSPEGDYRLARYSDIVLNKKIADSVFKLKTPGNVLVENH
jgi:outer membrane lipoprotein-sorting protein